MKMKSDIFELIGGAGHIGLPLGLLFANKGKKVVLYDIDKKNINKINNLKMPFMEEGGYKLLKKNKNRIYGTSDKKFIKDSKIIIICIGTPVKNNKPNLKHFFRMFSDVKKYLTPKKLIIIRSSIYPGTCLNVQKFLGKKYDNISYCPERVVQGKSISELPKLPQIVSEYQKSINQSKKLFELICKKIIVTSILEAELIKLFQMLEVYNFFNIKSILYNFRKI